MISKKELNLILGVITLVLFISAHFLLGIYFKGGRQKYIWYLSDIFLYLAIFLQLYIIIIISRKE